MAILTKSKNTDLSAFMDGIYRRNPNEPEFHQAVEEWAGSVLPFVDENPRYAETGLLERMTEPDRVISFKITWVDDQGNVQVNRGYRVQFNNAIGPYKGGLRFRSLSFSLLFMPSMYRMKKSRKPSAFPPIK